MKQPVFTGVCTALVTPFLHNEVNYPMLEQLIRRQIQSGISAIVISGTTGESPTLDDEEKIIMFRRSKEFSGNACTIIAGTGSNDTDHAVTLSKSAEEAGADALLIVSPYYNKATHEGLFIHYATIAASVHIPIILYNVPSRTGVDIPVEVYRKLSDLPNIAGVKEASGDITKITRIKAVCPSDFQVWTGNDNHIVPAMALGAAGVISVLSNVCPEKTKTMAEAALDGDFDTAAAIQIETMELTDLLFSEVNPIPVKASMKILGYDCGHCRLPLTQFSEEKRKLLETILK